MNKLLGKHERFSEDDCEPSGSGSKTRKLLRKRISNVDKDFIKPNF